MKGEPEGVLVSCPLFFSAKYSLRSYLRGRNMEGQVEKLSQVIKQVLWKIGKLLKREIRECKRSSKKSVMLNEYIKSMKDILLCF